MNNTIVTKTNPNNKRGNTIMNGIRKEAKIKKLPEENGEASEIKEGNSMALT